MNRNAKRKAAQTRRNVVLIVALMLVVCVASIGGTIAWLTDSTEEVVNTFSPSNIDLTLTEENSETFKIIPGTTAAKDPKVTIENDIDAYLFVEVDESWTKTFEATNTLEDRTYTLSDFITYTLNDEGWTRGTGTGEGGNGVPTNVLYREVSASATVKHWYLLSGGTNGQVTYSNQITKQMMDDLESLADENTENPEYPKLSFTAYAIQKDGMSNVGDAWNKINSSAN